MFCRDLHLTLRLSRLLQKDLFKGKWSLGKSCLKQNYCSACHTRFAVFFLLPSCCESLVSFLNVSQPGCLGSVVYKFHSSWLRLCFLRRIKKRSCDLTSYGFFTTKKNPEDPKKDHLQRQRHVLVLLAMTRRKSNINYLWICEMYIFGFETHDLNSP